MDKTDRLRDYGLAFLLYEQGLGICGYELIRELFIFIKLILNSYLYKNGRIANERVSSAVSQTKSIPNKVCILDCDNQIPIYSVFQTNGRNSWDSGKGTRIYFDLENPQIVSYHIIKIEDLKRHLHIYTHKDSTYNAIWIVKDNHVRVISIKTYSGKTHTRKQRR